MVISLRAYASAATIPCICTTSAVDCGTLRIKNSYDREYFKLKEANKLLLLLED